MKGTMTLRWLVFDKSATIFITVLSRNDVAISVQFTIFQSYHLPI